MLRKLLKYDFRSMWKQFSIVWPAALALGLLNRFLLFKPMNDGKWMPESNGVRALGGIAMTVFMGVMLAMFVLSVVYVIRRFYQGLLGREGYLMHTLPVKTWQLVASKLICAATVTAANVAVAGLAMLLMVPLSWSDLFVPGIWDMLRSGFAQHPEIPLYLLEFFLLVLTGLIFVVTQVYLSMAIGHLFSKHRVPASVAAYFVLQSLLSATGTALSVSLHGLTPVVQLVRVLGSSTHLSLLSVTAAMAVPAALFFWGACYILKHHLNLE